MPEETEKEGKTVVTPSGTVDDFHKNSVAIRFILLTHRQRDDCSKCTHDVEECIVLSLASRDGSDNLGDSCQPGCIESIYNSVEENESNEYSHGLVVGGCILKVGTH